jgi:hypothetical protein
VHVVYLRVATSSVALCLPIVKRTFLRVGHCLRAHDLVKHLSCQESQFHASFAQTDAIFIRRMGDPRYAHEQKSYYSVPSSAGERRGQLEPLGAVVQCQRKMLQKISTQQTIDGACSREGSQDTHLQVLDDALPMARAAIGTSGTAPAALRPL